MNHRVTGRAHWLILIVLLMLGLALYLYSERVGPPSSVQHQPSISGVDEQGMQPTEGNDNENRAEADPSDSLLMQQSIDTAPQQDSSDSAFLTTAPVEIDLTEADSALHLEMASGLEPEQTEWLLRERLIERMVVTINGMDGDGVPLRLRPLTHVPGLPAIAAEGDQWRLPETSDPRYQPYREMLDLLDPDRLVALYFEYQPAFEQAWVDLGMVDTDFHSRLIEVIDHLLAFERPERAPQLIRPEVLYEFSDPTLEQASWGHKLLMRIGPEHADAVQRKLVAVRQSLQTGSENNMP